MPRKSALKCHFGCDTGGPLHQFPKPADYSLDRFNRWKLVLSKEVIEKGDNYIYNNIRLCDEHFEKFYRCASKNLVRNAIPTLNLPSSSITFFSSTEEDLVNSKPSMPDNGPEMIIYPQVSAVQSVPPVTVHKPPVKVILDCPYKCKMEKNQLKRQIVKLKSKCKTLQDKLKAANKLLKSKLFLKALDSFPENAQILTSIQLKPITLKR